MISRTWQLAHRMKEIGEVVPGNDNDRILRHLAKYTINPGTSHCLAGHVGSLEPGKLAGIVLWHPAFFGAKPQMVVKGGLVSRGVVGDGNARRRT